MELVYKNFMLKAVFTAVMVCMFSSLVYAQSVEGNQPGLTNSGTVTDAEGNSYPYVVIGDLAWMAENLNTTQYSDGSEIPNVMENEEWGALTTGGWSHFLNNPDNGALFGKLYNWYAAMDSRGICPQGWRVPSQNDFANLEVFAGLPADQVDRMDNNDVFGGEEENVGGKLKSTSDLWREGNVGAEDAYGFNALPGGARFAGGAFSADASVDAFGGYWSTQANPSNTANAFRRLLRMNKAGIQRFDIPKASGQYIRCVIEAASVSTEPDAQLPRSIQLDQNYPNPFNPTTIINYSVADQAHVRLSVYDLLGRQVAVLVDETRGAGSYQVNFDASGLTSGIYLYRIEVGNQTMTRRMTLLK